MVLSIPHAKCNQPFLSYNSYLAGVIIMYIIYLSINYMCRLARNYIIS